MFDCIEGFYNATRRHSTIGYLSLVEFERKVGLANQPSIKPAAAQSVWRGIIWLLIAGCLPSGKTHDVLTIPADNHDVLTIPADNSVIRMPISAVSLALDAIKLG